jgi:integrase
MLRLHLRGGVYYYRVKLPADIQKRTGRTHLKVSLRTKHSETARVLAHELAAAQLRLCRAIRQHAEMTEDQISTLIAHCVSTFRANREDDLMRLAGPLNDVEMQKRRERVFSILSQAEDDFAARRLDAVDWLAGDLAGDLGIEIDPSSDAYNRLRYRLLKAQVDIFRQDASELLPSTPHPKLTGQSPPEQLPQDNSPKLSELVSEYLHHRDVEDPFRPNTRIEVIAALKVMVDLLADRPLASIRNKDAQDYSVRVSQLPKRWRQVYKGQSASEVLKLIEGQVMPCIEPATFNKEVGLVKSFWAWACVREERQTNPMLAIKPKRVGNVKGKRHPFTDAELSLLAPIIEAERVSRPDRYWVTTAIAYTGARLEEIAQLRTQDVTEEAGVVCIHIRDEAGSVKGGAGSPSERIVPVHSAVLAKGFVEFVRGRPVGRLWFDDDREKFGAPLSTWFGRQLTKLGVADRKKKGLHSFRHTMRDKLVRAGIDPITRREILGHAHDDVEDAVYGDPTGVLERKAAIEKVALPV